MKTLYFVVINCLTVINLLLAQPATIDCGNTTTGNFGQSENERLFVFENYYQSQLNIFLICGQPHLELFSRSPDLPWPSDTCRIAWGDGQLEVYSLPKGTYYLLASGFGQFYLELYCEEYQLPVELTIFEAIAGDEQISLHWQTASEQDNDHFELQRRIEGVNQWLNIAEINGHGNSQTTIDYTYTDHNLINGATYNYCLLSYDFNGTVHYYGQTTEATPTFNFRPANYVLYQNFPNPFNSTTVIKYDLPLASYVSLKIYDIAGREVANLVDGLRESSHQTVIFVGNNLPTGIYFYVLAAPDLTITRKMLLLK